MSPLLPEAGLGHALVADQLTDSTSPVFHHSHPARRVQARLADGTDRPVDLSLNTLWDGQELLMVASLNTPPPI